MIEAANMMLTSSRTSDVVDQQNAGVFCLCTVGGDLGGVMLGADADVDSMRRK
jgi:hypothetical protein